MAGPGSGTGDGDGLSAREHMTSGQMVPMNGGQDLSSEMSRQIASTSGAAHATSTANSKSHSSVCQWTLPNFTKTKQRQVWSDFQNVGGHECRLLVYPKGDSMALPGYISAYLQVNAPGSGKVDEFGEAIPGLDEGGGGAGKQSGSTPVDPNWECFVSYELSIRTPESNDALNDASDDNSGNNSTALALPVKTGAKRDSWHRFSHRKKSHGWCDFAQSSVVLDPANGFLVGDKLTVEAKITVLRETCELQVEQGVGGVGAGSTSGATDITRQSPTGNTPPMDTQSEDSGPALTGRFTWTIENLSHFRVMIKTQKVMSPSFLVGDCRFRVSVYQSTVRGVECLSLCLESKEVDTISGDKGGGYSTMMGKAANGPNGSNSHVNTRVSKVSGDLGIGPDSAMVPAMSSNRSCWVVFRMSAVNQTESRNTVHRDSFGRFAADGGGGDTTSLGWNDFMPFQTFSGDVDADGGSSFLLGEDGRAQFSVSFHAVREACEARTTNALQNVGPAKAILSPDGSVKGEGGGVPDKQLSKSDLSSRLKSKVGGGRGGSKGAGFISTPRTNNSSNNSTNSSIFSKDTNEIVGRFVWRLDNFTKLKDVLKKRKMSGLSVKSRRFLVGGRYCRLIVYPRGQSHPPNHLSMFLEVSDPHVNDPGREDSFVSHKLSAINQHDSKKSITRESQNRYGASAKDWGWREFLTLTTLFDEDAGFLVNDTVVFTAEVLILRETSELKGSGGDDSSNASSNATIPRMLSNGDTSQPKNKFNPKRLARFIAEYGLETKEAEAARFLFGDAVFEKVKQAAAAKATRLKFKQDTLSTDTMRKTPASPDVKRHALRLALGGSEQLVSDEEGDVSYSSDDDDDIDQSLSQLNIETPSPAAMAYVKAATDAKLAIVTRSIDSKTGGLQPLPGEGIDVVYEWKVELFAAFKDVLETKKIYSRFFKVKEGIHLRLGVYESWETLCVYVESDGDSKTNGKKPNSNGNGTIDSNNSDGSKHHGNHWVRYRVGLVNQKNSAKTVWKESTVCTKNWTSQVLQFMKIDKLKDFTNGFSVRDTVTLTCEVLDCVPWFDVGMLRGVGGVSVTDVPGTVTLNSSLSHDSSSADLLTQSLDNPLHASQLLSDALCDAGFGEEFGKKMKSLSLEHASPLMSGDELKAFKEKLDAANSQGPHGMALEFGKILAQMGDFTDDDLNQFQLPSGLSGSNKSKKGGTANDVPDVLGLGGLGLGSSKPNGLRPSLHDELKSRPEIESEDDLRSFLNVLPANPAGTTDAWDEHMDSIYNGSLNHKDIDPKHDGTVVFPAMLKRIGIAIPNRFFEYRDEQFTVTKNANGDYDTTDNSVDAIASRQIALLEAREKFKQHVTNDLGACSAFMSAIRACMYKKQAVFILLTRFHSGVPWDLSVLCASDVLRAVVFERLLFFLKQAVDDVQNAPHAEIEAIERQFVNRYVVGFRKLCQLTVDPSNKSVCDELDSITPSSSLGAICGKFAVAMKAAMNFGGGDGAGLDVKSMLSSILPQLVNTQLPQLVKTGKFSTGAGELSLLKPFLSAALREEYTEEALKHDVSVYFEGLRQMPMTAEDESVTFSQTLGALEKAASVLEQGGPASGIVSDTDASEAIDFAFFLASKITIRDKELIDKLMKEYGENKGFNLQTPFSRVVKRAVDLLQVSDTPGLVGKSSVLSSLAHWMLRSKDVFASVVDVLRKQLELDAKETGEKGSSVEASEKDKSDASAKPTNPPKTKAEKRLAAKLAAEREADKRELDAINAIVGKTNFPGRPVEPPNSNGAKGSASNTGEKKLSASEMKTRRRRLAPLAVLVCSRPESTSVSISDLNKFVVWFLSNALYTKDAVGVAVLRNTRTWIRYMCGDKIGRGENGSILGGDDIWCIEGEEDEEEEEEDISIEDRALLAQKRGQARARRTSRLCDLFVTSSDLELQRQGVLAYFEALRGFSSRCEADASMRGDVVATAAVAAARKGFEAICEHVTDALITIGADADAVDSTSTARENEHLVFASMEDQAADPLTTTTETPPCVFDMLKRVLCLALAGEDQMSFDVESSGCMGLGFETGSNAVWAHERCGGVLPCGTKIGPDRVRAAMASVETMMNEVLRSKAEVSAVSKTVLTAESTSLAIQKKAEVELQKVQRETKKLSAQKAEFEAKAKIKIDEAKLVQQKAERERDAAREKLRNLEKQNEWTADENSERGKELDLLREKKLLAERKVTEFDWKVTRLTNDNTQLNALKETLEKRVRGFDDELSSKNSELEKVVKNLRTADRNLSVAQNEIKQLRLDKEKLIAKGTKTSPLPAPKRDTEPSQQDIANQNALITALAQATQKAESLERELQNAKVSNPYQSAGSASQNVTTGSPYDSFGGLGNGSRFAGGNSQNSSLNNSLTAGIMGNEFGNGTSGLSAPTHSAPPGFVNGSVLSGSNSGSNLGGLGNGLGNGLSNINAGAVGVSTQGSGYLERNSSQSADDETREHSLFGGSLFSGGLGGLGNGMWSGFGEDKK